MKRSLGLFLTGIILIFSACTKQDPEAMVKQDPALKAGQKILSFTAHLSGDQEVPANESMAVGEVMFMLSPDGTKLTYRLIVANLVDVMASHIHIGAPGVNGGVVVFLYPSAPPSVLLPGSTNGILAEGEITAASLRGALAGQPLSVLIDHMKAGNAYVNAHTILFPGGEIRGQVRGN
jgi:hypothetical protein